MKQTEKQPKQIEFRFFFWFKPKYFFYLFRGHHSRKVSLTKEAFI
jgi:hypothetical protein